MEKQFLMKDISGRGYTRRLSEDEIKTTFKDAEGVDEVNIIDKLLTLGIGDEYDLDEWCMDSEWSATIIIRTK
jgi:hypothetical protein